MTIQVGDKIPAVTLHEMTGSGPAPVAMDEFCAGRKVVIIGVPGAFTPTCSARHLPGYKDKLGELSGKGVDAVACVSVNDAFVMAAWGKDQGVDGKVHMLADGNGEFARALGLEMDASGFGMGERARRFAILVDDGVVKVLNAEKGGEFEVSDVDTMLATM